MCRRGAKGDVQHAVGHAVAVVGGILAQPAAPLHHDDDAEHFADRTLQPLGDLADRKAAGIAREKFEDLDPFFQRGCGIGTLAVRLTAFGVGSALCP
ncbi:hypothetical protein D3C81_1946160 [compost metagenome]